MADERHHKYGPSTLDSLSLCVRFKFRARDVDDAADEGTLLHKAFETGDLRGLTDEQASCVRTIRDYVDALKFEHGMSRSAFPNVSPLRTTSVSEKSFQSAGVIPCSNFRAST